VPWSSEVARRVRALALDLDGTLIDSRRDIALATNFTLAQLGLTPLPIEQIASYVGDGALALIQRATGFDSLDPRLQQAHSIFRAYYTEHAVVHTRPYEGVEETLRKLRQTTPERRERLRLAVCTNKPRASTEVILHQLKLADAFDLVTAGDDFENKKPHPEPLLFIAKRFGLPAHQVVMVGDGPQDIACAQRAGALAIGVSYGMKTADDVRHAGPDCMIEDFRQLPNLLELE
jgi:phosphoglycolate phosphatase